MSYSNNERQLFDVNSPNGEISPLSSRFLVAQSSPVHDSTDTIIRIQDDSFQSSSSNSKSGSSTASRSSRLQVLMIQHQSAVNSPLMYSRCTSLGSLASYDISSTYNDSYTSECSSIKPSGRVSPSDMPDSPPCEPEILEDDYQPIQHNNLTLTLNTTSIQNRTTMMSVTANEIENTLTSYPQESISNSNNDDDDGEERHDEVHIYSSDSAEPNDKCLYENKILFYDKNNYQMSTDQSVISVCLNENLSIITEESSFIEELNSNDEINGIKVIYDFINKPHWTLNHHQILKKQDYNTNSSISSNPSSLSLDSNIDNETDDEDEYDQEQGRQLIERLIEETLARRSLPTDFLHSTSCVFCPSNTPMSAITRSTSSSSSSSNSISTSTKSCTCITNRSSNMIQQPQRSQSSPARPSSTNKQKENTVQQTRSSFLRLRKAQQNKGVNQQDKRF